MENQKQTGIGELRNKTNELINIINDVIVAVPYGDSSLRKQLILSKETLNTLLEELQHYA